MKLFILPGFDGTVNFLAPFIQSMSAVIASDAMPLPADKPLGYEELAQRVMQKLPDEDFILLGQSFSGPLCIRIAEAAPARLRGIILSSTFAVQPLSIVYTAIVRLLLSTVGKIVFPTPVINSILLNDGDSTMAAEVRDIVISLAPDVFLKRAEQALSVNVVAAIEKISVPTLVLEAGQDRLLRRGASLEIVKNCRQAKLVTIDGPHLLLQRSPERCAIAVSNFIHSLS